MAKPLVDYRSPDIKQEVGSVLAEDLLIIHKKMVKQYERNFDGVKPLQIDIIGFHLGIMTLRYGEKKLGEQETMHVGEFKQFQCCDRAMAAIMQLALKSIMKAISSKSDASRTLAYAYGLYSFVKIRSKDLSNIDIEDVQDLYETMMRVYRWQTRE